MGNVMELLLHATGFELYATGAVVREGDPISFEYAFVVDITRTPPIF
jgi:hypothetical protein